MPVDLTQAVPEKTVQPRIWTRYQMACEKRAEAERMVRDITLDRDHWRNRATAAEARLASVPPPEES